MSPALHLARPAADATTLDSLRLGRVKRAYTTRHFALPELHSLCTDPAARPLPGDLVLARVERIGKHAALELTNSRRSTLFVGDEVLVAYAERYAPDQFEAHVPDSLAPCHLAAGGGVAATVVARRVGIAPPTELCPLGLVLGADGRRLNLRQKALPTAGGFGPRPLTLASLGTSMNAGKTTSAAHLIHGLARTGLRVGAAKITGTGSGNDPGLLLDAGAHHVLDFTDCGHASTAGLDLESLLDILNTVQAQMQAQTVDVLVLEVADGLLQRETAMLLRSPLFRQRVDGCLFSSGEALGAVAGAHWLLDHNLPLLALSGAMTRSPLAAREAADATGLSVLGLEQLRDADTVRELLARAGGRQQREEAA
jgi:hypothetical protein